MANYFTVLFSILFIIQTNLYAQSSLKCNMSAYKPQEGLTAGFFNESLTINWEGAENNELKLQFIVRNEIPVIKEIAIRAKSKDQWSVIATNVMPEYRVVSGTRRVTQQQTEPLEKLGIELTEEVLNEIKWEAFWDAPLYITDEPPTTRQSSIPAPEPFANHPGMPRKHEEVTRAKASYHVEGCKVKTNGTRLEIVFEGVEAGIFKGYLQYDIYKGSNLVKQTMVAKTDHPSAAFKYDAGLTGLPISESTKLVWRDIVNKWQNYQMGGFVNEEPVIIRSNNRLMTAELDDGSLAVFPPPHRFYWARETEENLGYSWYRKDSEKTFSFGMRQAEIENMPEFYNNFALYSARPGTWQQMPVFFYISPGSGEEATKSVLAFTNGDTYRKLEGHKVMGHHYHVGIVKRLNKMGGLNYRLNDVETMKGIGMEIYSIIDGARGAGRHDKGELFLQDLHDYYEACRSQSDKDFLVIPNDENSTGGRPPFFGGHYDILISKPLYWRPKREDDQPLYEQHPKYGKVYNIGTPNDMMEMTELENVLISLPHPWAKGSTGYPDAFRDSVYFQHENYFSLGYRWGMGIDASEIRLGEYRFLNNWDKTNNWLTSRGLKPKFALAISEARSDKGERGKPPYDDAYGMSPVNYLKIDEVPTLDDMSSIVNAMKLGEYFITTGEVLIPFYQVQGKNNKKTIVAELEWTFPLDFVEVVWGDGVKTDRQIIPASDLSQFGKKRFEIPFDAKGKSWVRFAAWDVAGNGALVQPVYLGN